MSLSHAQLVALTTNAATDLQELAHAITRTVDTLPRNASRGTVELLEQQARRALAIAAALRVEEQGPDEGVVRALLAAKRALTVVVIAVLATVAVGFGEEVGSDAYRSLKQFVETRLQPTEDQPPTPRDQLRNFFLGERLRSLRELAGMSQQELGRIAKVARWTVSRYESGRTVPEAASLSRIITVLAQLTDGSAAELWAEFGMDPPVPE